MVKQTKVPHTYKAGDLLEPEDLGKYIKHLQGDLSDVNFALQLGITRPSLRAIKSGANLPRTDIRGKMAIKMLYQILEVREPVRVPKKLSKDEEIAELREKLAQAQKLAKAAERGRAKK